MRRIDELHLAWRSSTSVSPSATRKATARGHGNAPAIVRRGDPVRFQLLGFCVYPRAEAGGRRHGPQNARRWSSAADLPDMSKCFSGKNSCAGAPRCFAWGCFRYFGCVAKPPGPSSLSRRSDASPIGLRAASLGATSAKAAPCITGDYIFGLGAIVRQAD
jgi:hypothetical protein